MFIQRELFAQFHLGNILRILIANPSGHLQTLNGNWRSLVVGGDLSTLTCHQKLCCTDV
jgi:hypothetical protein